MTNTNDFGQWLLEELERRDLSYSEVARRGGTSHARISQVISGGNPGVDFCHAIARALDIPPENVFRRAGLLPSESEQSEQAKLVLYLFERLSSGDRRTVLTIIRSILEQETDQERRHRVGAGTEEP